MRRVSTRQPISPRMARGGAPACSRRACAPDDVVWRCRRRRRPVRATPSAAAAGAGERPRCRAISSNWRETSICHSDPERFALLYRLLLAAMQGEPALLTMRRPTRRCSACADGEGRCGATRHKMTAFVRFRAGRGRGRRALRRLVRAGAHILAATRAVLRRPLRQHALVDPDAGRLRALGRHDAALRPGGATRRGAARGRVEDCWRTYYAAIFNPARLKVGDHEARDAEEILAQPAGGAAHSGADRAAPSRAASMIEAAADDAAPSAAAAVGARERRRGRRRRRAKISHDSPRRRRGCRRCPLCETRPRPCSAKGRRRAELMFVGEQPGDQEDLAGQAVRRARRADVRPRAGARPASTARGVYVTNAVKHFKFEPRGKRRIHQTPERGGDQRLPVVAREGDGAAQAASGDGARRHRGAQPDGREPSGDAGARAGAGGRRSRATSS